MIILKIIAIASFALMTGIIAYAGIMGYFEEQKLSRAFHTRPKTAVRTK
ncbi:MAG: hypothetical protein ACYC2T_05725 [Bacillota bacterium]